MNALSRIGAKTQDALMAIGPWQILVVALLLVLLFGASRIAGIGKGLGEGIRNFKKGLSDDPEEKKGSLEEGKKE